MFPQARKAWTGHSFILGSMILIPHILKNGQALCYPATWLIADICVNSNLKTLLSQILQEKGCVFVLQTEITFILVFSEYEVYMVTVLVLQATNNSWVHERLQPSLTATLYFTPANGFAHTKGRTYHSVSCLPRFHREAQPIHSLEQAQGTTRTQKSMGSLASQILQVTQQPVRQEGDVDRQERIKYSAFGEPLEMARRANPPLCRASWEMTAPTFIAAYLWRSVLSARALHCPISPPSCALSQP